MQAKYENQPESSECEENLINKRDHKLCVCDEIVRKLEEWRGSDFDVDDGL